LFSFGITLAITHKEKVEFLLFSNLHNRDGLLCIVSYCIT